MTPTVGLSIRRTRRAARRRGASPRSPTAGSARPSAPAPARGRGWGGGGWGRLGPVSRPGPALGAGSGSGPGVGRGAWAGLVWKAQADMPPRPRVAVWMKARARSVAGFVKNVSGGAISTMPLLHEHDTVCHLAREGHFMGHDQQRGAGPGDVLDHVQHFLHHFRSSADVGSSNSSSWLHGQARDGDALLLSARQLARPLVLVVSQAHAFQQGLGPRVARARTGHARAPAPAPRS